MMRARNIKPGFFKNELLAEVSPLGRILFSGLWCAADREGRLEDRPRKWKAEILPYDDCDVDELLDDLTQRDFIIRYEVGGIRYIQVVNFTRHQNPHKAERLSVIPPPCEPGTCTTPVQFSHGTSTVQERKFTGQAAESPEVVGLIPDSGFLIPDTGVNNTPASGGVVASHSGCDGFERFWQSFPVITQGRKAAKVECRKRWQSRGLEPLADIIVSHVEAMSRTAKWLAGYDPAPLTYLNQRHWEDGLPSTPAYTPEQVAVFDAYNRVLGEAGWPEAVMQPYSDARARAITAFLTLSSKPDWLSFFLEELRAKAEVRPDIGFDWVIHEQTFLRVKEDRLRGMEAVA
jgi:hypothetical protein